MECPSGIGLHFLSTISRVWLAVQCQPFDIESLQFTFLKSRLTNEHVANAIRTRQLLPSITAHLSYRAVCIGLIDGYSRLPADQRRGYVGRTQYPSAMRRLQ